MQGQDILNTGTFINKKLNKKKKKKKEQQHQQQCYSNLKIHLICFEIYSNHKLTRSGFY